MEEEARGVRFEAANRCIYCDATEEDGAALSEEHIIPFALGGGLVLPKASCEACQKVTSRFEAVVLRGGLRGIKERLSLQTRSKTRPKKLPLFCVNGDEQKRAMVDVADYPAVIILPRFAGPTIADFPDATIMPSAPWGHVPAADYEMLARKYGIHSFASNSIDSFAFARMVAKIGLGWAEAKRPNSFRPLIREAILSDQSNLVRYIGSIQGSERDLEAGPHYHRLSLKDESVAGRAYLTCEVQLFANLGGPAYRVVVGQMKGDFNPLLDTRISPPAPDLGQWRCMLSPDASTDESYNHVTTSAGLIVPRRKQA